MHNSQALANRNFVIRQGDMRRLYEEGTGSVMVKAQSVPFQGVPRVWDLLSPAAPNSWKGHIATTGACLVFIKNRSSSPEAPAAREFNLEAARSPASVLDVVRTIFGMNISDTAEVFGITRQTAYQWIKFTDMEQVRSNENRVRIKQALRRSAIMAKLPAAQGALAPCSPTHRQHRVRPSQGPQIDHDACRPATGRSPPARLTGVARRGRATQAATALTGAFAGLGAGRKSRNG